MSVKLLRDQEQASMITALPVVDVQTSMSASTQSDGTINLYYYSSGTRTLDAGQAAGTVVDAKLTYTNILSNLGGQVGSKANTSLTFTCAALTTEVDWSPQMEAVLEGNDKSTQAVRAAAIGAFLSNYQYVVDYRRGMIYGKKGTTATALTSVTYKYGSASSGGSFSYDSTSDSDKVTVLNPDWTNFSPLLQEDVVNQVTTAAFTRYLDVEGVGEVVVQFDKTGGSDTITYTIGASAENNGTADTASSYIDITQYGTTCLTAGAGASFTADVAHRINCKGWKFLKFDVSPAAGSAGDADFSLFVNQAY